MDKSEPSRSKDGTPPSRLRRLKEFPFLGPWDNTEAIDRWRQEAEFQAFLGKARELCEDIQPRTLNLVALVPA